MRDLKIRLQSLDVRDSNPDLEGAFREAVKGRANAVITITNNFLFRNLKRITDLSLNNRLPSMYEGTTWVEAGGLMSYSANDLEIFRRAATYVDKILKGAKPADLPVAAEEVRVHHQPQSGKTNRPDDSAECAGESG